MRLFTIAALALATSGCGGIYDYRPRVDTISYEVAGMSGKVVAWRIDKEGQVTHTIYEPVRNNHSRQAGVTRRFNVGRDDYLRIDDLMSKVAQYRGGARHSQDYEASRDIPCDSQVTDQGNATIVWENPVGALQLARVDLGCGSTRADAIRADLQAADRLMQEWTARAPAQGAAPSLDR